MIRLCELSPEIQDFLVWLYHSEWNQRSRYSSSEWTMQGSVESFLMDNVTWVSKYSTVKSLHYFTDAIIEARNDNKFLCEQALKQTAEYSIFLESFAINLPVNIQEFLYKMKEVLHVL